MHKNDETGKLSAEDYIKIVDVDYITSLTRAQKNELKYHFERGIVSLMCSCVYTGCLLFRGAAYRSLSNFTLPPPPPPRTTRHRHITGPSGVLDSELAADGIRMPHHRRVERDRGKGRHGGGIRDHPEHGPGRPRRPCNARQEGYPGSHRRHPRTKSASRPLRSQPNMLTLSFEVALPVSEIAVSVRQRRWVWVVVWQSTTAPLLSPASCPFTAACCSGSIDPPPRPSFSLPLRR